MAEGFMGAIRMVGFTYAPDRWINADGQILPIAQYTALFSLYGTTYGGDGVTTFGIPDFRGRVPMHTGRGPGLPDYPMGIKGGYTEVTLQANQAPTHTHPAVAHAKAGGATQVSPENHFWAEEGRNKLYCTDKSVTMNAEAVEVQENAGGGQPHTNMQPFLTIRFCVCVDGTYPPRP